MTITVSGGAFVSATYLDDGAPADTTIFRDALTIDRLFAYIHQALAQHPAMFTASYDPTLGHPVSIAIDYNALAQDDETGFRVLDLRTGAAAPRP